MAKVSALALGERIRSLRQERGFTFDALAKMSGASKSYIWELENRAPPRPSADKLSAIAKALGVTAGYLIEPDSQKLCDAEDAAFFSEYIALPEAVRRQVRQIARILQGDCTNA
jgi:transcriptional regulator with XRE-family HTH domain